MPRSQHVVDVPCTTMSRRTGGRFSYNGTLYCGSEWCVLRETIWATRMGYRVLSWLWSTMFRPGGVTPTRSTRLIARRVRSLIKHQRRCVLLLSSSLFLNDEPVRWLQNARSATVALRARTTPPSRITLNVAEEILANSFEEKHET